jgi:hypothetical protein
VTIRTDEKLEIAVPEATPVAAWLPTLEARLRELLGRAPDE